MYKAMNHSMIAKSLLIIYLLIAVFKGLAQTPETIEPAEASRWRAKYSMQYLGANIGEFTVSQTSKKGRVNITAISDVNVNLLFRYRVKYVQNTVYNQGVLQSSYVETYKNGKLNSNVCLKQNQDSYLLINDGDTTVINDLITYSGSLIYFNEPIGIKQIYKERSAEMRPITSVSEHSYIIKDENDREINRYYYEDGILQNAQMKHLLGNLELKRIND